MKKWLVFLSFASVIIQAQQKPFTVFDTVAIDEVVVVRFLSLNDGAMVDKYQSTHFSSLDKINARLSGVSVISRGAYAMEPVLHSFSAGQINVTIDGMKMFGACTDKMDPVTSYVETVNLNNLQIWHGSSGSRYGSTIGGSYDMKLKTSEICSETIWQANGGIGFESTARGMNSQAMVQYSGKKFGWRMSGVFKDYNNYMDGEGNTVSFTHYRKANLHNSFLYQFSKEQSIKVDFLLDDAFDIGYPALPMDVSNAKGRIYALEFNDLNSFWNIQRLKVKLYANTVYHLMDDSERDSLYLIHNSRTDENDSIYMKMDMPGWSNTYGMYVEGHVHAGNRHKISFRLDNYFNQSKAEMTMYMNNISNPGEPPMYVETWPKNYRQVTGIYLRDLYRAGSFLQIELNTRIDFSTSVVTSESGWQQFQVLGEDIDKPYNKISKSINLNGILNPEESTKIVVGLGFGERLPTLSEQFGFYLFNAYDGYDYIGNPDLTQEKSTNFFLNANYTAQNFKLQTQNYFYTIEDYILGVFQPELGTLNLYASGVKHYENIPTAQIFSTGIQGQWNIFYYLEIFGMFKYTYGKVKGEPIPLIPPLKSLLSFTYLKEKYFVTAETELSSKQDRINEDFGELQTDGYAVFNLRAGSNFEFSDYTLRLSAGIDNFFNTVYSEHLDWGNYYKPGRNFYIHLQIGL